MAENVNNDLETDTGINNDELMPPKPNFQISVSSAEEEINEIEPSAETPMIPVPNGKVEYPLDDLEVVQVVSILDMII
ncbi:hypothetical protein ACF0H5_015724 [Mactra antiquata]